MQVTLTGVDRWAVQGVGAALRRHGLDVAECQPAEAGRATGDVLLAVGFAADEALQLEAALPRSVPVLWLGGKPPRRRARPTGTLAAGAVDERLLVAVQALAVGLSVHDEAAADANAPSTLAPGEPLTPRELQVFELMAKGLNNRDIAQVLGVSSHTAKFHVAQILEKTGSATRTEAVGQGLRAGWIGI